MPKVEETPYIKFREFIGKAEKIYAGVKEQLENEHWGEIIVIEPDSGHYFVDKNRRKAMQNAEEKYPDKLFHMRRIGDNPAVTRLPARVRPAGLID